MLNLKKTNKLLEELIVISKKTRTTLTIVNIVNVITLVVIASLFIGGKI